MDLPPVRTRRFFGVVMLATLVIFGGLLGGLTWQLRTRLRAEVLRREAEAINAVALMQLGRGSALAQFGAEFALDDMFAAVLESAALRGVLAVQLFDGAGRLRQARPIAPDDAEARRWWALEPATAEARFHADGSLDRVSPLLAVRSGDVERLPLVEIVVPLRRTGMPGVALYWVDGAAVAQEFSRMDVRLAGQGIAVFGAGALLVGLVLGWAFARLADANRRLEEQRADLARANEELDFAAKTGALGAISAHLIHGLKNPLAGIEGFVAESAEGGPEARSGEAVRLAVQTTQRLRALVNEVTTVLRDEADGGDDYPIPAQEILEAARGRTAADAAAKDVRIAVSATTGLRVGARCANLAGLVIANLVTNALEASPAGGQVAIEATSEGTMVGIRVRDSGPGLPPSVRAGLFRPVRSGKPGGGGVGLAISHRLARHAGGSLELMQSAAGGTEFRLLVPAFTPP